MQNSKKMRLFYKPNKTLAILLVIFTITLTSSCKKWLDVQPEDKFTKDQIYRTPEGVAEVINGFYQKLGNESLYGGNLSLTVLDVLAQRYRISSTTNPYYVFDSFSYGSESSQKTFNNIWTQMYATIANINDLTANLPKIDNGLTSAQKNQYLGEAIGLRAFIHFDLLRMFGQPYNESTADFLAIPYYRELSTTISDFSTNKEVVQFILEDIAEAEALLADDPIRGGKSTDNYNNNRFNYYAVLALKARVYQWIDDKPNALSAAKSLIDAQNVFPWVTHSAITITGKDTDRKFFSENIFSVFNPKLNELYVSRFDGNLLDGDILATGADNAISKVYENYEGDYRYTYLWPYSTTGVGYRTFIKYADISNKSNISRFMVPVIRISEMYYIAAESTEDPLEALDYLNIVRRHRNLLVDISNPSTLRNELTKEYMKEFYGEGQLFYYYKRIGSTSILSMTNGGNQLAVNESTFIIPIPQEEFDAR